MVDTPSGTVTFLFTDIEGSTALWERRPLEMKDSLARHDGILREIVEAHGGYVFKMMGDACCAAFASARDAVRASLETQRALLEERWPGGVQIRVRMAMHTGVSEEREGDYFGPPVNRVARLLSTAHGGQVLLSDATHHMVRDHLAYLDEGTTLRDLGERRLKDLTYPERVFQIVSPSLPDVRRLPDEAPQPTERYRIKELLGQGGMAKVFLAHDEELDRDVAYKRLNPHLAGDEDLVERFSREAKSAASLSHPNIVPIYDRGRTKEGAFYIIMEYLPGGTLEDLIRQRGTLPAGEAIAFAREVADALEEAHEQGIIHRDIKPQNVLLTKRGGAKVADFGIARAASSSKMTRTGAVMGTPHYVSPEQVLDKPATAKSDLYSLGVTLYEMLTGRVPHDAETPYAVMLQHVKEEAQPPKEANPEVPDTLDTITLGLLAKDPDERYPDAATFIEDLQRAKRGELPKWGAKREGNTNSNMKSRTIPDPTVTIFVPDLSGMSLPEAEAALKGVSLRLGKRSEDPESEREKDEVVGQSPAPGTGVSPDTAVSVVLSAKKDDVGGKTIMDERVKVPDLIGSTLAAAAPLLADTRLEIGASSEVPSEMAPKGEIIHQDPPSGTEVPYGSAVRIVVSSGGGAEPERVRVPDLTGLVFLELRPRLEREGLRLGLTRKARSEASEKNKAILQNPLPGTEVGRESVVDVTFGAGNGTGHRKAILIAAISAMIILALTPVYIWGSSRYFLDAGEDGNLVAYRGLPATVAGIPLNGEWRTTSIDTDELTPYYRTPAEDNRLYAQDEIEAVLGNIAEKYGSATLSETEASDIKVPNVVGQTVAEARLTVGDDFEIATNDAPGDIIVKQNPSPFEERDQGSNLYVSASTDGE